MAGRATARELRLRLRYWVERFLARGAGYRLLFIAGVLGLMSVAGGGVVLLDGGGFDSPGEAFWWAFLRLSDPGYLGDDQGRLRVVVATVLTVVGYVVFVGALVATMTQWLNATLARMELGLTPVRFRGHVAILGWTERTPAIVRGMLESEGRLRRWIEAFGAHRLRLVILHERLDGHARDELASELPRSVAVDDVVLRAGSPLEIDHLARVAADRAAAVVVPGTDFPGDGRASQDARTIKTLLALAELCRRGEVEQLPSFVGELYDPEAAETVHAAYPGRCELVATEPLVGRLLAASVTDPGLVGVVDALIQQGTGVSLRIVDDHEEHGTLWRDLALRSSQEVPLGIVRTDADAGGLLLAPPATTELRSADRIVVMRRTGPFVEPDPGDTVAGPQALPERVLVLGWNRKAPRLLEELRRRLGAQAQVRVISNRPADARHRSIVEDGAAVPESWIEHVEADYGSASVLEEAGVGDFDRIVVLASEVLASGQDADARTIATLLRIAHAAPDRRQRIVVELADASSADVVRPYAGDVLVSPRVSADFLAQVVLRQELHAVLSDLIGHGGADLRLVSPASLGLSPGPTTFGELRRVTADGDPIVLGVRLAKERGPRLLPPDDDTIELEARDAIVVVQ